MQKQNIGFIRKYIVYLLFLFLSLLIGVVDFFSNSFISNYFPDKLEVNLNLTEKINFSNLEFTNSFYFKHMNHEDCKVNKTVADTKIHSRLTRVTHRY